MGRKKKIQLDFTPSSYQQKIFDFIVNGTGNAVISAFAGSGKCLGVNTEVLMFDGTIKKVQDISIGDKLMGDDNTPRTVLTTTKGVGKLKKIIPINGEEWVCNDVHILTLAKYDSDFNNENGNYLTVDVPINELENEQLNIDNKGFYTRYKLLKAAVEFSEKGVELDPWLYGIWLSTGSIKQRASRDKINNILVKSSNENGNFILKDYLINCRVVRLQLLAGIIDSVGRYSHEKYYVEITGKQLTKDILFLARSLGLGAYSIDLFKKNGQIKCGIYIYGDIWKIPVSIKRKIDKKIVNNSDCHTLNFKIEDNGIGDYYGFTIDGNGRFLLSDFTVTHNTSTIVNAIRLIPNKQKAIFIAFNKSIADELNNRLKKQTNSVACTSHSLGYKIIRRNLGNDIDIDEYKYRTYLKKNIVELSEYEDGNVNMQKNQMSEYVDNITKLIDYSRLFLCKTVDDIDNIAQRYDLPLIANECEVTLKCLEWGKNNIKTIDFADMLWLPYALDLQPLGITYDWVFIDEAQDSSKAAIELFKKCVKQNGRWVAIGDEKQTINLFASSSEENFKQLCDEPYTQVFQLPISYRCGKNIIKLAQTLVPGILPKDDAIDGEIKENCKLSDIRDGDMILARSKATLLTIYTKLIKRGINCYIKGSDIGSNLINILDSVDIQTLGKSLNEDGVFVRLYDRLFNERNKLVTNRGLDIDDATLSSYVIGKYDIINALEIIAFNTNTKDELKQKIKNIFKDNGNGICLSTIHKSKGLEADNVYIACQSSLLSKHCHHEWEKIQEKNLVYVAYTRAKKILGFISEKEVPLSGSSSNTETILNDLQNIENIVCGILGKPTFNGTNSVEAAKSRLKKIEKVELPENKTLKVIKTVANKKDSNDKLLSDLEDLI